MADTGQIIGGYKLRGLLHTGRERPSCNRITKNTKKLTAPKPIFIT